MPGGLSKPPGNKFILPTPKLIRTHLYNLKGYLVPLILVAIILGLVQGLGEFLPISSSGHLILVQTFLGLSEPEVSFHVVLHLGTMGAVLIFYHHSIFNLFRELVFLPKALLHPALMKKLYLERPFFRFGLLIIIGSIPTAIIGLSFQSFINSTLSTPLSVGLALLVTGVILRLAGSRGHTGRQIEQMTIKDALIIGFIQGLAIVPGFSRSGFTICAGLFLGLNRESSARYSFLLSMPAICGAAILEVRHLQSSAFQATELLLGFVVAAISGYLALKLLANVLKRDNFGVFSWWCWGVGLIAIGWTLWADLII